MKELNKENLDTAIALGDAVCAELDICCSERGKVIFRIYSKLEELRAPKPVTPEVTVQEPSKVEGQLSEKADGLR